MVGMVYSLELGAWTQYWPGLGKCEKSTHGVAKQAQTLDLLFAGKPISKQPTPKLLDTVIEALPVFSNLGGHDERGLAKNACT